MEAVLDNLMDMVKVLIYATDDRAVWASKETTQVDLTLQDKNGHSVIHLCVQNREVSDGGGNFNSGLEDFSLLCLANVLQGLSYDRFVFACVVFCGWRRRTFPYLADDLCLFQPVEIAISFREWGV